VSSEASETLSSNAVGRFIVDQLAAGKVAAFPGHGGKTDLAPSVIETLATMTLPRGIRLHNARIDGALDLGDATLAALVLEDCEIGGVVHLAGARLGRLSLRGSRFSGLDAHGAAIAGDVDFARAGPLASESWIDLGSAEIRGSIDGCDSELNAPPSRAKENVPPWDHHYALRLSDAHIGGSVLLNGKVVIRGGFCLDNAHVRGSVWGRGATVIAGEGDDFHPGDAVHGHCAQIDGMLGLCFGFRAQGRVWMLGARIGDRVTVGFNVELKRQAETWDWGNSQTRQTVLLLLDQARIDGWVRIDDFTSDGGISMNHARIGAGLSIANGRIANGAGTAIDLSSTQIDGNVLVGDKLVAEGRVLLAHARIHGQLDCRGATITNKGKDGAGVAIDARWVTATDGVLPRGLATQSDAPGLAVEGRIDVANARLGEPSRSP
jgi:hypothetical protein